MDSAGTIALSIQAACADLGLSVPSDDAARHIIGLGLNEAIAELLPDLPKERYGDMVERYRFHFLGQDHQIPLFPGVTEAIEELNRAGFMLAVATGKSRRGLDRAFEYTGLGSLFHATRCADESFSKPHPGMLLELMDEMGTEPGRTLMIGDTTHDLQMAENARVPSLAVSYGAHPRENLVAMSPLACLDNFDEVTGWIRGNA